MQLKLFLATALLFCITSSGAVAGKFNRVLNIGDPAPDFEKLEGVDGKTRSLKDFADADALVLVFTCNHCPVAQAYEQRMNEFLKSVVGQKVRLVAINCSLEPADSLEKMKEHAAERKLQYPYLSDPSQDVGRAYGATVTPHVFVLDRNRKIAYMGAFDDNFVEDRVEEHYVSDAVKAVLAGKTPEVTESRQKGCSIEYQFKPKAKPPASSSSVSAESNKSTVELKPLVPNQFDAEIMRHRGKVIIVDFWATWCLPCRAGFKHTVAWHARFADQGLAVLSVSLDDSDEQGRAQALKFLKTQDARFPNFISSIGSEDAAFEAFDIEGGGLPHYKLFDREGRLIQTFGVDLDHPLDHREIEAAIEKALKT